MRSKLILAVMLVALVATSAMADGVRIKGEKGVFEYSPTSLNLPAHNSRDYFQGFEEGVMPPTGWGYTSNGSNADWVVRSDISVLEGSYAAYHSWSTDIAADNVMYFDYTVDVAGGESILSFFMSGDVTNGYAEYATETVEVTHAGGTDVVFDYDTESTDEMNYVYVKFFVDLGDYDGQTVTIGFRYNGFDANSHYVDAIMIDDGTGFEAPDPEPFSNDTCEGALDMQALFDDEAIGWFSPTCDTPYNYYTNTYDGGCAPWGAPGTDQVYSIYLTAGETFTASVVDYYTQDTSDVDYVIYVVTDCADLAGTCIAAADDAYSPPNAEYLTFDAPADGVYYFILDSYSGCSDDTVIFVDNPVATEDASFGSVKAMYR